MIRATTGVGCAAIQPSMSAGGYVEENPNGAALTVASLTPA
jgi:hypothetical protein